MMGDEDLWCRRMDQESGRGRREGGRRGWEMKVV